MTMSTYKRFEGVVPEPGDLEDEDWALLEKVRPGLRPSVSCTAPASSALR